MPSASPGPILCTSRSENRFAVLLLSAATGLVPVVSEGVWQNWQPIELNNAAPFTTDAEEGPRAGWSRKRMKVENSSMPLVTSVTRTPSIP